MIKVNDCWDTLSIIPIMAAGESSVLYVKLDEERETGVDEVIAGVDLVTHLFLNKIYVHPLPEKERIAFLRESYGEKNKHNSTRASGFDLYMPYTVSFGGNARGCVIDMGFKCEMLDGEGKNQAFIVAVRSSTAATTPLRLANGIGIIDEDYRGNIKLILDNTSSQIATIEKGQRIAQICLPSLSHFTFRLADSLSSTERGEGGIGSTGK